MNTRRLQGSIVDKNGLWYGVADLGRDARGKRSRKWTKGFAKRREAERALAKLIANGSPTVPARFPLEALVKDYIDQTEARGRQRTTVERYRSLLRCNIEPHIGKVKVGQLRSDKITQLYTKLHSASLSPTTVAHVHGLLMATFRWARRAGRMDTDPMLGVEPPQRAKSTAKAMRADDARDFFAWLPTSAWARWHPFFLFALATGMRRGEILALRKENLDTERGVAIVAESLAESTGLVYRKLTKTEHIREVPLSDLALEALRMMEVCTAADERAAGEAYEDHDLAFPDARGRFVRPMAFSDAFRQAANGIKFTSYTLHTLRHTAATWLLTGGADVRTTSSILGHSDAATTLRVYSHVVNERQRSAIELIGNMLNALAPANTEHPG